VRAILSFAIEVVSMEKGTTLSNGCQDYLASNGAQVVSSSLAKQTCNYKVVGVDTANKKPFKEEVAALDEQEAEKMVSTKSKVVADVTKMAT
jgi:hypothetical protein